MWMFHHFKQWLCLDFTQKRNIATIHRQQLGWSRDCCRIAFRSHPLPQSSSSLINQINLYCDSFRLCAALQKKGAVSNLIKEDGIHVWERLQATTCSHFIKEISLWKILWSISKQLKCNRFRKGWDHFLILFLASVNETWRSNSLF